MMIFIEEKEVNKTGYTFALEKYNTLIAVTQNDQVIIDLIPDLEEYDNLYLLIFNNDNGQEIGREAIEDKEDFENGITVVSYVFGDDDY